MPTDPPDHASDAAAHQTVGGRRDQSVQARLHAADQRDANAHARDLTAFTRDQAADARNLQHARRDAAEEHDEDVGAATDAEVIALAAGQCEGPARRRAESTEQDARAAEDRRGAAWDREQAACERLHALVDRELLAGALALAAIDPLTGARARAAGLTELDREHVRCRRTGGSLVVAYVDVVGLKALNDSDGHGAGDALLKRVVGLIQGQLRSYDLIIRVGGDEFVCAMSDMMLREARQRFSQVAATLTASPVPGAIRAGLAELEPHEGVAELIARADSELLSTPHANH